MDIRDNWVGIRPTTLWNCVDCLDFSSLEDCPLDLSAVRHRDLAKQMAFSLMISCRGAATIVAAIDCGKASVILNALEEGAKKNCE